MVVDQLQRSCIMWLISLGRSMWSFQCLTNASRKWWTCWQVAWQTCVSHYCVLQQVLAIDDRVTPPSRERVFFGQSAVWLLHFVPASTNSQGSVYYCQQLTVCLSLCLDICPSVTLLQIASTFLFLDGIEPFFGRHFSICPSTNHCSSIFYLGPLTPKIYSPEFAQNRL